ncbi:basic salivary proline-rich protein 2-like [Mizuhopecten yessoensis]|uniref:basic salivary proline-rich protein 2-like n=1 Tax=Mizuhopecten yessoensis TaxID=6573 RepID=UPI000B45D94A|nr:basic salivary proline-rich protein 2-like [Mizuhopecten yessoensis]
MSKSRHDIDKDTVVAYHDFIQGQIKGELNGVNLGPGRTCCLIAGVVFVIGLVLGIVGILVITLRMRHVYLWDWNDQFLGPAFIVLMLLCVGLAVFLIVEGKRRANAYRRDLVFRPIGDYGVAVVHKSRLNYEEKSRDNLKSGTTPHQPIQPKPYQPISYDHEGRPRKAGYENRAYGDTDPRGPPPRYEERGRRPDDRRGPDRRGPDDRRRPPGDRPRGPPDDRTRPDRPRMPHPNRRGPPRGPDDRPRRPPGGQDDRPRRPQGGPDDRPRGPPGERRRGPPGPDDRRRPPGPPGDRYRDDRRRMDEDRRREEKRREAEGEPHRNGPPPGDNDTTRVLLSRDGPHDTESEF